MYNLETVESLHSYGRRLQSDRAQFSATLAGDATLRRSAVRELVRRVRRTA
jgi:hypothetical protein